MTAIKFSHDKGRFSPWGCNFLNRDTSIWEHGGNMPVCCTSVLAEVVTAQMEETPTYDAPASGAGHLFYYVSGQLNRRLDNIDVIITGNYEIVNGYEIIPSGNFVVTVPSGNKFFTVTAEVLDDIPSGSAGQIINVPLNLKSGQACIDTLDDLIPDDDEFTMTVRVRKP